MVVNLCLPHFNTTAHCSKVTLTFGFQVEVCRVDVELWPWGMDRGQACKRLEISTSSDPVPSSEQGSLAQNSEPINVHVKQKKQENDSRGGRQSLVDSRWSRTDSSTSESDFKLVARCELREATKISFTRSSFRPRAPFLSPPPPVAPDSRQGELWSRGELSLGSVSRLSVTMPFGGSASSLGLKALIVWGQPAPSCPTDQVERVKRLHEANERQQRRPAFFSPSVKQSSHTPHTEASPSVPEEFLDPLTQEVMTLPMLLPSGVSVDNDTLEEYQRREATWGRAPNDPFTSVPFTPSSQPLPNPLLKSRIDHFLLETGMRKRNGTLGRKESEGDLQTSRLLLESQDVAFLRHCTENNRTDPRVSRDSECSSNIQTIDKSVLDRRKKRNLGDISKEETEESTAQSHFTVGAKKPKYDDVFANGGPSHEQRLSASLDEALFSALQGRPSFTSNLTQNRKVSAESEPLNTKQQSHTPEWTSVSAGEKTCSACSCPLSLYSSASSVYRLTCGHLLCRTCVQTEFKQQTSPSVSTSKHILCPRCQRLTPGSRVVRVHH
ncbi:RING finger protein 37 isoform X2 [Gouania willdenowi]|uniref:RING finger protein 37 n=1 Tax=Gouania willdenowi TaxID=441366 RepID=A0A8C5E6E5_GOUWI|nr:RING finger protein 37 isoform X2 [Gouania willdenowi]